MNPEDRIKEITRQLTWVGIIDAPGYILIGLGLYAKFGAEGDAFHPMLNNDSIVNGMLIVGGAIAAWGLYKILTLSKEKSRLQNEYNL